MRIWAASTETLSKQTKQGNCLINFRCLSFFILNLAFNLFCGKVLQQFTFFRPWFVPAHPILDATHKFKASHPHCSAIACAIPSNVRLRSFQRSGPGDAKWTRGVRPSTILVGCNGGRFSSHKHVAFVSPCQNCQG